MGSVDDPEVHEGADGWLFLTGGSNRVLGYYTDPATFPALRAAQWIELLARRRERCRGIGAAYRHVFAPDKLSVYDEHYRGDLPLLGMTPARQVPAMAAAVGARDLLIDILPALQAAKADAPVFWRTDTHWTFEGCRAAYRAICAGVGISPREFGGDISRKELVLDLGGRMVPPVTEAFVSRSFLSRARRVEANALVRRKEASGEHAANLHVGSHVVYANAAPDAAPVTVVLFGDSFAEYRPHLLTGMLAETVRALHFIWSSSIDWRYVERVRPDLVLTETAERFAATVPDDTLEIEAFARERLAKVDAGWG